jgi:hypothetical protein
VSARGGGQAASAPTFTIGPLAAVIEAARLEKFVREASHGERLLYAAGPCLPRGSATVMLAREFAQAGLVHLFAPRGAHGFDYIAERSSVLLRSRTTAQHGVVEAEDPNSPLAQLRGIVMRAADFKRGLQTNASLAALCNLKDANAVKYRLRQILEEGEFRLIDNGPNAPRGVVRVPQ